jgi:broad-specificity NMP kinase
MIKTYFINGVPGSGKSTLIPHLRSLLGNEFDIHDFDERGVPDNVTIDWRKDETKYWIDVARENSLKDISTIICGNSVPNEIPEGSSVIFIMLDLNESAIKERLLNRYSDPEKVRDLMRMTGKSPEESIAGNIKNTHYLRELCSKYSAHIIDTSSKTPQEVAQEVAAYILKSREQ